MIQQCQNAPGEVGILPDSISLHKQPGGGGDGSGNDDSYDGNAVMTIVMMAVMTLVRKVVWIPDYPWWCQAECRHAPKNFGRV